MIQYSDIIIDDEKHATLSFYCGRSIPQGSYFAIKKDNEIIMEGNTKSGENEVVLPVFQGTLTDLKVDIKTHKSFHNFNVTIMKLPTSLPYIICDIDFTVSATSLFHYITNNILHMKSVSYSSKILTELNQIYPIIYLTGRGDKYTKLTKIWIKKNNFPAGPIIARRKESALQLREYKQNALTHIVKINPKGIGIGDLKSDIHAYMYHNLTAIKIKLCIFKKNKKYKEKKGYYQVHSWHGIKQLFNDIISKGV